MPTLSWPAVTPEIQLSREKVGGYRPISGRGVNFVPIEGAATSLVSSWSGTWRWGMGLVFEWDGLKATQNESKHGVSFEEARTIFGDIHAITADDPDHSHREVRLLQLGMSSANRLLVVAFTERDGRVRIISARKATRNERQEYEENI